MPQTTVIFFRESNGRVPMTEWLDSIQTQPKARVKILKLIQRLKEFGTELRRPESDYLRDGVYELRIRHERINYRVLYFFSGQNLAILSAGLVKKDVVPESDIIRALDRKKQFMAAPDTHSFLGSELYV
ncbi:MAG: type II toxin-antitoxin system RelE/ParE family toxin [Desulfomonilaceae bacterium]